MSKAKPITLACTSRFIKQLKNIPREKQNAVNHFIQKFPEDPTLKTWDLKTYSGLRDPHLHFARVSLDFRVVLYPPLEKDNTWTLLWVDHKPKIKDWAKNKKIFWNDKVQVLQSYDARLIRDVPGQKGTVASSFINASGKQLLKIGAPEELLSRIQGLSNAYDLACIQEDLPTDVFENLSLLIQGISVETIIRQVEAGKIKSGSYQKQKNSPNNRHVVVSLSDLNPEDPSPLENLPEWRVFLHPTQRHLATRSFNGTVKVTGGAGTGKTVAALHRVTHLTKRRKGRVFFTTYTRALIGRLQSDLRSLNANMAFVHVDILDRVVAQLARELSIIPKQQEELNFNQWDKEKVVLKKLLDNSKLPEKMNPVNLQKEYQEVILENDCRTVEDYLNVSRKGLAFPLGKKQRRNVWNLLQEYQRLQFEDGYKHPSYIFNEVAAQVRKKPELIPYQHIVADEIQDFDLPRLRILRALAPHGTDDLFLVGDPFQNIYSSQTNFKKVGINVKGKRSKKLTINYRTTEEIRNFAIQPLETVIKNQIFFHDFNGKVENDLQFISIKHGHTPAYELFTSKEEELKEVERLVKIYIDPEGDYRLQPSEIAVASLLTRSVNQINQFFYEKGIKRYHHRSGGDTDGIRLFTLHSLKGLEFKVVFLTGISEQEYHRNPPPNASKEQKQSAWRDLAALLYVACSRAILYLHVSGTGKPVAFIK